MSLHMVASLSEIPAPHHSYLLLNPQAQLCSLLRSLSETHLLSKVDPTPFLHVTLSCITNHVLKYLFLTSTPSSLKTDIFIHLCFLSS